MDKGEHWIGAAAAGWFCFYFAGGAATLIAGGLAVPAALYLAGQSEAVASLARRFRTNYPLALAGCALVVGLAGLFSRH